MLNAFLNGRGALVCAITTLVAALSAAGCNSPNGVVVPGGGTGGAGGSDSSGSAGGSNGSGGSGSSDIPSGNAPKATWTKAFPSEGAATLTAIALDPDDQPVIATACDDQIDFGGSKDPIPEGPYFCVAKFDANGNNLWSFSAGDPFGDARAVDLAASSESTILLGHYSYKLDLPGVTLMNDNASLGKVFVAEIDKSGKAKWAKAFGEDANEVDEPKAVALDPSGNIVITGTFPYIVDFGGGLLTATGTKDIFLAKLSNVGGHLWSKHFGVATESQYVEHMAVDKQGRVLLTGSFDSTANFGGAPLMTKGGYDIFVAALDKDGGHLWSKSFGSGYGEIGQRIGADSAGNVYVAGDLGGNCVDFGGPPVCGEGISDVFLVKFDPAGKVLWAHGYGDAKDQLLGDMAIDAADNVYLTGYMRGAIDFGGAPLGPVVEEVPTPACFDVFVAKIDAAGSLVWSGRYGDTYIDEGTAIGVDSMGSAVVGGVYSGLVDFGAGPLAEGDFTMFLTKLPPK